VVVGWQLEEQYGQGNKLCRLMGFDAKSKGETKPIWSYEIEQCITDFVDSVEMLVLSDDGSTVAVLVETNSTLPGQTLPKGQDPVLTAQVHILDATSGKLLFAYSPPAGTQPAIRSCSITAHGEYVVFANGGNDATAYIIDVKAKKLRVDPMDLGLSLGVYISPDGNYLVAGYWQATVYQWNTASKAYAQLWQIPGQIPEGTFLFYSAAFSSNNGDPLVSVGWTDSQAIGVRVDMARLKGTGPPLWTYVGPLNEQDQNIVSAMSMHQNYVAVSTWGSFDEVDNPSPQILLFNDRSNSTVLSFITPGSMFAVDVLVVGKTVWVAAAGKHVQANTFGNGGDLFVLNTPVP